MNVWKLNLIDFSSTNFKTDISWQCTRLAYNPHYGLLPSEQHGSQNSSFFPYTICKITLIGCFVCGLIHYAADVTVWKSSLLGVDVLCWIQFKGWAKFPQPSEWMNFTKATILGHHFIVCLGSFKQYQFISMYFMLFPMNRLGKWNYFTQTVQIKKINIDKNNLYVSCTQNWEVPISYHWCHTEMQKRTRENSVSNTAWESPLLKLLKYQWHIQSQNF